MQQKTGIFYLLIFMFSVHGVLGFSQQLIRNAGFEEAWTCPEDFNQEPIKELVPYWKNPNGGTPDYFHTCSDKAGVPDNFAGNADAPEGKAYIGLILREVFDDKLNEKEAAREYVEIELDEKLEFRKLYCFNLKYRLASKSKYAIDGLGAAFTREKIKAWNFGILDAEPMVFNLPGNMMENKDEWIEMCGVFRARGREKYLSIGNFIPSVQPYFVLNTDSLADDDFPYAYYYIDDVKLYKIDNEFECGCQDNNSAGYDWLNENSQSYLNYYYDFVEEKYREELLAANQNNNKNSNNNVGNASGDNSNLLNGNAINGNNSQNAGDKSLNNNANNTSDNVSGNDANHLSANSTDVNNSQNLNGRDGNNTSDNASNHLNGISGNANNLQNGNQTSGDTVSGNNSNQRNSSGLSGSDNLANQNQGGNNINDGLNDYGQINPLDKLTSDNHLLQTNRNKNHREILNEMRNATQGFALNLPKVYFAYNQSELLPSSYPSMEYLAKILTEEPSLQIEIRGHTDNIGSNRYNKKLSEERAKSVYQFLIEAGISKSRLTYVGFGNTLPIADNTTDFGRQLNRRVEIFVTNN